MYVGVSIHSERSGRETWEGYRVGEDGNFSSASVVGLYCTILLPFHIIPHVTMLYYPMP